MTKDQGQGTKDGRSCVLAVLSLLLLCQPAASAAEIYLRARATVNAAVVRLGDVADVAGDSREAEQLVATELFPLPSQDRYVTARQVREALLARRVDLNRHSMSGASIIEILPQGMPLRAGQGDVYARRDFSVTSTPDRSHPVTIAVERFLKARVHADLPWQVELRNEPQSERASLPAGASDIAVTQADVPPRRGAIRQWLGTRQFVLRAAVDGRRVEGTSSVMISLPPTVVVAARDLARGAVLQDSDLRVRVRTEAERNSSGLSFPEEAVSQQTLRAFRAEQVIEADDIEAPELVHRGERVNVVVYRGGVRVQTEGRARDSGALGDLVMVEAVGRRQMFQAKVSGVNEVQIETGGAQRPVEQAAANLRRRL